MVSSGEAITGNLICLRPGSSVADQYTALFTDPAVERWIRPEPLRPFTPADLEAMARRDRAHWDRFGFGPWAVWERDSPGTFVGRGGLSRARVAGKFEFELPWAVIPALQNRGYAGEMAAAAIAAAREMELERVVSLTLPANKASRRVMEKAGLELVGEIEHVGLPHLLFELRL